MKGLGIFKGQVRKIRAEGLKIPHMGWNSWSFSAGSSLNLFKNLPAASYVYFVHSFQAVPEDKSIITASATYGERITAAVAKENVMAGDTVSSGKIR